MHKVYFWEDVYMEKQKERGKKRVGEKKKMKFSKESGKVIDNRNTYEEKVRHLNSIPHTQRRRQSDCLSVIGE